ncbi:MAG: DUF1080 domain-containing protein [Bacteroidaceae bacterium]|nr:DUF1080 domain-containing protein [Bacteroidaceae bacterium]
MKKTSFFIYTLALCVLGGLLDACGGQKDNTLSKEEIAEGWELLFNGVDMTGWRDFNGTGLTNGWKAVDGVIQAPGDGSDGSGYIVTERKYADFELAWDWKLTHGGNSGMIYHVVENPCYAVPYVTGPEYQLIDNEGWEEVNAPYKLEEWQKLGVDYAMHLPDYSKMNVRPQGEWNSSRIVFDNGHVEHWLNGQKILEFEAWTPEWFVLKGSGKWAGAPEYGLAREGVVCLQDHGDPASFKNIKIRPLPHRARGEQQIFNGKDLTEWELFGDARCSVNEEGAIVTENGESGITSYLCTRQYYKDFDLTYEFRQEVDGNTGVFFHGFIDEKNGLHGGEVEMGPHGWNNGGIFSAETRKFLVKVNEEQDAVLKAGEWNTMRLRVEGNHIQTWLNGQPMADIEDEPIGQAPGRIMLQVDGKPVRILWRNFKLTEL